uniref:Uncharacterized protein n=1 Tax=Vespula pensylvanica TaxID=30213 RepID=A0A834PD50_VESPE|nr:hypothetical protein H0235_004147 [Vespula pensylvanica]
MKPIHVRLGAPVAPALTFLYVARSPAKFLRNWHSNVLYFGESLRNIRQLILTEAFSFNRGKACEFLPVRNGLSARPIDFFEPIGFAAHVPITRGASPRLSSRDGQTHGLNSTRRRHLYSEGVAREPRGKKKEGNNEPCLSPL